MISLVSIRDCKRKKEKVRMKKKALLTIGIIFSMVITSFNMNFENVDVNQSVEENQVMKGYTSIALVGLDSREGELDGDVNSDTMIIASINNDTKKVKLDVSKLKAKKKYYIRVRTYKTVKVNGKSKKIYSGWSKVKAVTTKK